MIADLWYRNAVLYSLDVETYLDSDGDGFGDFEGLIRRLDYLHALGVDAVWLAPFQPTPDRDDGYDITDFYGVDPRFGSGGDFVEFMHEASKRGIRVIMDLVVNHTSDEHRWFQEGRKARDSRFHDWYVWSDKRPKGWNKGMVFPGHQPSTWTYDDVARRYFFHRFYDFQPDLNNSHPSVREEIRRILGYWVEQGVAGFRVDAVPFILEVPDPNKTKWDQDFDFLYDLRRLMQLRRGDAVLLGEANVPPGGEKPFFGRRGEGLQMMFNFWVNQHLFHALASADIRPLVAALKATRRVPQGCQWAHFLRNHDELDLGRLEEEQRAQVFAEFAPEPEMQLYDRGIRRRLAPMLGDRRRIEMAYSLLFSLPGTPVIRYGDEIGMGDDLRLPEREPVRTPMQWSAEAQGGFSTAEKLKVPVIAEGVYGYPRVNVAAQRRDPDSLLNWTESQIRLRKECPEIGWGEWTILPTGSPHVLAIRYEWRGSVVITMHNFSAQPQSIRIPLDAAPGDRLVDLRAQEESRAPKSGKYSMVLDPYGYRWMRPGGVNPALHRARE